MSAWPGVDFLEDELVRCEVHHSPQIKAREASRRADQDMALPTKLTMCCASDLHAAEKGRWCWIRQQEAPGKGSHWPRHVTIHVGGGMSPSAFISQTVWSYGIDWVSRGFFLSCRVCRVELSLWFTPSGSTYSWWRAAVMLRAWVTCTKNSCISPAAIRQYGWWAQM